MISALWSAVFLVQLSCLQGAPIFGGSFNFSLDVQGYLHNFGYLKSNGSAPIIPSVNIFSEAIKTFQQFAHLPVTGQADEGTVKKMAAPRCGVSDAAVNGLQRFVLGGSKWPDKSLTWAVSSYTKQLNESVVDAQLTKAWKVWSDNTNLTFTKAAKGQTPNFDIFFAKGDHKDGFAFDGKGKVLAHAFYPRNGRIHFDEDEIWAPSGRPERDGTNLFQVAAHEFGHALGLDHSKVETALMAPFYRYSAKDDILTKDDISGIQTIYPLGKTADIRLAESSLD
ncbi:putative Matrix metalloproteinase-28 [Hypsibius exemplaris]|uniref:Matrix metalloproteinase-28 n=1 Tax=Hypsibius exemplaris TaxID=2072580 RepID=A0A9X6RMC6_HYPEX|nr:putative Matrix metalloproteinase-28 [Hypsibius exemplaris]